MSLVSCICPTYNRYTVYGHLLEEAVESFLRQTYPHKELIIINDTPGQVLVCDKPGVKVLNLSDRIESLGKKYNIGVSVASGKLICPWEDDDISLPHRLSLSVELLLDADYYNPNRYWYIDREGLHHDHAMGVSHNCSIYKKSAWYDVGGYPHISGAQDAEFHEKLKRGSAVSLHTLSREQELRLEQYFYIYRWGVSNIHLSGRTPHDEFYKEVGAMPVTKGLFQIHPRWRMDYGKLCRDYITQVINNP